MGKYYSQWDKLEPYLEQYFHEPGFFLEIGAWDGEVFSQTAFLEREKGWEGVCVEPFPKNFENRECLLCTKAISADGKPRKFMRVTADKRDDGDVTYLSGFVDSVRTHLQFVQENCYYFITDVDTITIPDLYEQYHIPSHVDFLSVDVEGSEVEIFNSIDFNKYAFSMITYEHNGDKTVQAYLRNLLERNGYMFLVDMGWDDIFLGEGLQNA